MNFKRVSISQGSCNFCNRGKLAESGEAALVYPYSELNMISGKRSIDVRVCDDCFMEMVTSREAVKITAGYYSEE